MVEDKAKIGNILVTGGSGFLGMHLVKKLLDRYDDVRIRTISRNENEVQRLISVCSSNRLETVVADIRDSNALRDALTGVNCLMHLAAMKHIDLCELNPMEATSINVIGTMNLLELFNGDTFVGMSTDKALEARGCYGATKLLTEKLILGKAKYHPNRRYMVVRSGNIFGSSGSVIEKWRHQIQEYNEITVTNLEMTRFFIDIHSLTDFIIEEVVERGETAKIYIPFQKAIVLKDLAKAVIGIYGNGNTKIEITGLRTGEKEHEILFLDEDVVTTMRERSSRDVGKMNMDEIRKLLRQRIMAD